MTHRALKMAEIIRRAAASIARMVPADECGIVSITDVAVSRECSHATVFVSALQNPKKALSFMKQHTKEVNALLSDTLHSRRLPELTFVQDGRSERGERIDKLLRPPSPR